MTIKDVLDYGTTGILAVGVWALWLRLNSITDRLFGYLEDARIERAVSAKSNGLDTQDLERARREATRRTE